MLNRITAAISAALVAAIVLVSPAASDQSNTWSPTTGTVSGLALTNNYNNALKALQTCNSGASAPVNDISLAAVKGQCWLDTTAANNVDKQYDGTTWLVRGYLDTVNHRWLPPIGGGTATVASATTTDLGASANSYLTISGITPITGFGSSAVTGTMKVLTFSGALTLTYSSPGLILPTAANITTAPGDTALAVATGSGNWTIVSYTKADGSALNASSVFAGAVYFNSAISPSNLTSNTNDWAPTGLSTANTIRFSCNASVSISGITASATDGKILALDNIGSTNACVLTSQDTNSSAANRLALVRPISVRPLSQVAIRYDLTTARWKLLQEITSQPIAGGFKNLRVFNAATAMGDSAPGTPNVQMIVKADELTLEDASGNALRLSTVSVTGDISASGAGGLDTSTASAPNAYYLWVIYNPTTATANALWSTTSAFGSLTLPSGYTFGVRVGWNYYVTANAVTGLRRVIQYGRRAQHVVTAGSNTIQLPQIIGGSSGSITAPTWTATTIANVFVPGTASAAKLTLACPGASSASGGMAAPSNAYGAYNSTTNAPPLTSAANLSAASIDVNVYGEFLLESTSVYYAANAAGCQLLAVGWEDNL